MGTLVLAGLLAFLIGGVLGLLGGGGGVLAVPLLVYLVGLSAKSAIASSLFFVGATSAIGAGLVARSGKLRWKMGALFSAGSMTGAFAGGHVAQFISGKILLSGLALMMLVTGIAMLVRGKESSFSQRDVSIKPMLVIGAVVGVLSGLVGAGGGFLIVPALLFFGRLPMREAVGTSLFIITLQSFAGFVGQVTHVELDWLLLALMTSAAIVGMFAGFRGGKLISAQVLRRAFSLLVFATGSFILIRELPLQGSLPIILVTLILAAFLLCKNAHMNEDTCPFVQIYSKAHLS